MRQGFDETTIRRTVEQVLNEARRSDDQRRIAQIKEGRGG